jgi:hypothetical protein
MTYKQIVDNIKQIVNDHYILADFGYGQISDIKNGSEDTEADYPYAFLNPGTHTRGERSIIYRFNLIVMDMYVGDHFLTAQSQCQQYIDDILAELKYNNNEIYDININASLTPFKERFQDVVGGMTATIDIEVPQKLNLCIAPISDETLINRVFVNVEECPAFDTAFRAGAPTTDYPQYTKTFNEFFAKYDEPGEFTNCNNKETPLAINNRFSTTEPYYNGTDRNWKIPAGVEGVFRLRFNLELTNVQGIDLSSDRLRIQLVINGQTNTYYDLPALPIDGTIVPFSQTFEVDATSDEDEFSILFRYVDEGTPAPDGPLVGYTGTAKIFEVE